MTVSFKTVSVTVATMAMLQAHPAACGWKMMPANTPQHQGALRVNPETDWNRASAKPGKLGTIWTHDGFDLNQFQLFAGVAGGQPVFRDRKRNPMPKFRTDMLAPDLVDFFEKSFRAQYRPGEFTVLTSEPIVIDGRSGVGIRYRYVLPDDPLTRLGEARLVVSSGKLFVLDFEAPALYYFNAGIGEARHMMNGAKLN